jgi:hypothetical protein
MPTKPLDRLMFTQGGNCFFCRKPLSRADASVEHLVAVTNGGKDYDENCVACCKGLNRLFGHMSLKEKLHIVLNQRGEFRCPIQPGQPPVMGPISIKTTESGPRTNQERLALVVADLQKRGNARPGTVDKLLNTIRARLAHLGDVGDHAGLVLGELSARSLVIISDKKVTYALPPKNV